MTAALRELLARAIADAKANPHNDIEAVVIAISDAESILAHLRAEPWQPIETAPRDGTWILVIDPNSPMCWAPYGFSCWTSDYTGKEYWCEEDTSDEIFPTHWQPLPTPPKES